MNQTKVPDEFMWNGETYTSLREAGKDCGLTYVQMYYRVAVRGYTSEDQVTTPSDRRKPVTWNGKQYESIKAAANARGISRTAMKTRLEKGYRCDADLKVTPPTPVRVGDRVYRSFHRAVRELTDAGWDFKDVKNQAKELDNAALVKFAVMPVLIRRYKAGEIDHKQVKQHLYESGLTWGQFVDALNDHERGTA